MHASTSQITKGSPSKEDLSEREGGVAPQCSWRSLCDFFGLNRDDGWVSFETIKKRKREGDLFLRRLVEDLFSGSKKQ